MPALGGESLEDTRRLGERLARLLRLRTDPVGVKLLEEEPDKTGLALFRPLRDFRRRMTFCQAAALARYYGWPVGLGLEDLSCPGAIIVFGLAEPPEYMLDGSVSAGLYTEDKRLGERLDRSLPRLPPGRYKGIAVYSLREPVAAPDAVLVYLTPGQATKLIAAFVYKTGEPVEAKAMGKAGSCSGVARAILEDKPVLIMPGYGDRSLAWTMEDEVALAFPGRWLAPAVEAMEKQSETNLVTYPVRPFLFYEFRFRHIPVVGELYDRFLRELRGGGKESEG